MVYCPGTDGDPCRSGRGGGSARAHHWRSLRQLPTQKGATSSSPASQAASTAASAAARHDSALADAHAALRSMQSTSDRITDDGLKLVGDLVDHLKSISGIPGTRCVARLVRSAGQRPESC